MTATTTARPVPPGGPPKDQAPVESSPFGQPSFDASNEANAWSGRVPQIDSPYHAASAPEAAGPQGAHAPGHTAGPDEFPHDQQDVGSYANYASGQHQEQAGTAAQPQQDDAGGDAWQSPPQWNDVIGGGAPGTGPRRDA